MSRLGTSTTRRLLNSRLTRRRSRFAFPRRRCVSAAARGCPVVVSIRRLVRSRRWVAAFVFREPTFAPESRFRFLELLCVRPRGLDLLFDRRLRVFAWTLWQDEFSLLAGQIGTLVYNWVGDVI